MHARGYCDLELAISGVTWLELDRQDLEITINISTVITSLFVDRFGRQPLSPPVNTQ